MLQKNLNTVSEYGGIINNAMTYQPTLPVYYSDTTGVPGMDGHYWNHNLNQYYTKSDITGGEAWNPVAQIAYAQDKQAQDKVVADWHADFKPVSWAKFTTRLYVDYAYQEHEGFNGLTVYGTQSITADTNTNAQQSWDRWFKYGIENFVTFTKSFGDHAFELLGGQGYENYNHIYLNIRGYDVPYQDVFFAYPSLTGKGQYNRLEIGDGSDAEATASYFGRLNYNYKEKILFAATVRRDGSSKFGPKVPFATFPSFSAGYNIFKEDFFKNIDALSFISNLKLRASWGQNGSKQNLGSFPYMTTMTNVYYVSNDNSQLLLGKRPGTPANQGLLWETSEQTDLAADFGLFKNSLTVTIDWYKKLTKDQIASKSDMPFYLGLSGTPAINSGKIENKGWEFDVNYKNSIGELKYNINFNASYLKNKVLAYLPYDTASDKYPYRDGANIGQFGVVNRYEPGLPVWYLIGYEATGIFQSQEQIDAYVNADGVKYQKQAKPGDVIFKDLNGDGTVNTQDIHYLGKPMPDWTFGLNFSVEYKGFDLSASFQGQVGNQIFLANYRKDRTEYNKSVLWYDNRWTPTNGENKYPRATNTDANQNYRVSSLMVYSGNYMRMKNITIGYTLPQKWSSKFAVNSLRVYFTGTNLLTFTKYPGTDPEVGMYDTNQNASYGVDKGLYPPTKVNTLGINVTF
jgi:TonB-linked SusC/RagA family outer membrane protein